MHERAVAALKFPKNNGGPNRRAQIFFTGANTPIEETHQAARRGKLQLQRMTEKLGWRTEELAASHRELQRGVVRRKVMEAAAEKCGQNHKRCLAESLQLQKRLRQLTHRVMAAQEDDRHSISRELQDEIAQMLLGINVRLLSLKQQARHSTKGFKDEIASTQRRVAREFGSL